jgi:large subunit ribosomal protein L5
MNTPPLLQHYKDKVVPNLKQKFGYTNPHQIPRLEKIVVTSCMGKSPDRKLAVDDAAAEITKITGQRPSISFSKKAVANFKLREGEPLGARVTLRGPRMWEFFYRFINITAPNIRDFRGISSKSFDGRGNFACGIQDQAIFPEIEIDQIKRHIGFDLIFVTSAPTDAEGRELLAELGMPFRDMKKANELAKEAAEAAPATA